MRDADEGGGKLAGEHPLPALLGRPLEALDLDIAAVDVESFLAEKQPDVETRVGGRLIDDDLLAAEVLDALDAVRDHHEVVGPGVRRLGEVEEILAAGVPRVKIVMIAGDDIDVALFQRLDRFFADQLRARIEVEAVLAPQT